MVVHGNTSVKNMTGNSCCRFQPAVFDIWQLFLDSKVISEKRNQSGSSLNIAFPN
jgi:hypothetical protein